MKSTKNGNFHGKGFAEEAPIGGTFGFAGSHLAGNGTFGNRQPFRKDQKWKKNAFDAEVLPRFTLLQKREYFPAAPRRTGTVLFRRTLKANNTHAVVPWAFRTEWDRYIIK